MGTDMQRPAKLSPVFPLHASLCVGCMSRYTDHYMYSYDMCVLLVEYMFDGMPMLFGS